MHPDKSKRAYRYLCASETIKGRGRITRIMLCRGWGVQVAGHDGETTWARRRASRSRAPARYTLCDAGMWVVATATRRIMRAVLLPGYTGSARRNIDG